MADGGQMEANRRRKLATSPDINKWQSIGDGRLGTRWLLQVGVLRFGLLQDGDVGVGVFPESEETPNATLVFAVLLETT